MPNGIPKRIGKGELLKKAQLLVAERQNLIARAKTLKEQYQNMQIEAQSQIAELRAGADGLAQEFRRLFRESQDAYSAGDGALAKELSLHGRTIQNQCETLNAQANDTRNRLKAVSDEVDSLYKQADYHKEEAFRCKREAGELRKTSVRNFETSKVIDNQFIEELLDGFPPKIFEYIKKVEYNEKIYWQDEAGKLKVPSRGETIWEKDNKAIIRIGMQPRSETDEFEHVLAHEIGHVIYKHFMSDHQKAEWFTCHDAHLEKSFISPEAIENEVEDFSECFAVFQTAPQELELHDVTAYNLVSEIYGSIESDVDIGE